MPACPSCGRENDRDARFCSLAREAAALLEPLDFIGLQADVLTVLG